MNESLRRGRALSPGLPYRLARNEFKFMEHLKSPFICKVTVAIDTDKGHLGIMEAVLGGELAQLLQKTVKATGRGLHESAVAFYASQISLALIHIHQRGIIFRDLKAENVLLATDGYIKIIDFGLAKETRSLTHTLCGTPVGMHFELELIPRKLLTPYTHCNPSLCAETHIALLRSRDLPRLRLPRAGRLVGARSLDASSHPWPLSVLWHGRSRDCRQNTGVRKDKARRHFRRRHVSVCGFVLLAVIGTEPKQEIGEPLFRCLCDLCIVSHWTQRYAHTWH